MRIYKIELYVIDHDGVGEEIGDLIRHANYPNDCINPHIVSIDSREIGEWSDDHPLNNIKTSNAEYRRLFSVPRSERPHD